MQRRSAARTFTWGSKKGKFSVAFQSCRSDRVDEIFRQWVPNSERESKANKKLFEFEERPASVRGLTAVIERERVVRAVTAGTLVSMSILPWSIQISECTIFTFANNDRNRRNLTKNWYNYVLPFQSAENDNKSPNTHKTLKCTKHRLTQNNTHHYFHSISLYIDLFTQSFADADTTRPACTSYSQWRKMTPTTAEITKNY